MVAPNPNHYTDNIQIRSFIRHVGKYCEVDFKVELETRHLVNGR